MDAEERCRPFGGLRVFNIGNEISDPAERNGLNGNPNRNLSIPIAATCERIPDDRLINIARDHGTLIPPQIGKDAPYDFQGLVFRRITTIFIEIGIQIKGSLAVIAPILVRKNSPHGDFHNTKLLQEKHTHLAVDFSDFPYLLERSTLNKTVIAVARVNLEFSGIT